MLPDSSKTLSDIVGAVQFWKNKQNGRILQETAKDTPDFKSDSVTTKVTKLVNGGSMKLSERKAAKKSIGEKFISQFGACK